MKGLWRHVLQGAEGGGGYLTAEFSPQLPSSQIQAGRCGCKIYEKVLKTRILTISLRYGLCQSLSRPQFFTHRELGGPSDGLSAG